MPGTWAIVLTRRVWSLAHQLNTAEALEIGDPVLVSRKRSPLARQSGKIADVDPDDTYGPYLVLFDNGLRFRYQRHELRALTAPTEKPLN